jgi:hypothetical protein
VANGCFNWTAVENAHASGKIGAHNLKQTSISKESESISHFINTIL